LFISQFPAENVIYLRFSIIAFFLAGSIGSTAFAGGDIIDDAWKSIQSTPYDGITNLR
jgi:hypothetical protein